MCRRHFQRADAVNRVKGKPHIFRKPCVTNKNIYAWVCVDDEGFEGCDHTTFESAYFVTMELKLIRHCENHEKMNGQPLGMPYGNA